MGSGLGFRVASRHLSELVSTTVSQKETTGSDTLTSMPPAV